ncbi:MULTISPECIES: hypothetical protein [Bacillus cereus group]|uniref:hypothetical protein n=1 Tax=Bacillus cereus group TaxID=86661 RepID=UPI000A39C876|nr:MULTISPECIES: hypothetical protein [Bacillus cereus group]MCU5635352.1 hypothetical protein [Bacillus cereus]OUB32228.1 hypothetical protein BK739_07285 [Bacillus thuringiensis serovar pirenaica]PEU03183.1 hypothetical protein CN534_05030 [Bacillus cereus]PEZ62085.1 hypothetical protein CN370_09385 [Bacillus cereus]PFB67153.1 hypothetical protein CN292_21215 [Bacillus cereus]
MEATKTTEKTLSDNEITKKVTVFYYTYQKIELAEERIRLVESFLSEELLVKEGDTPERYGKVYMRHPVIYRKSFSRNFSVLEILAEFIMQPKQYGENGEKHKEYPVSGVEREHNKLQRQKEKEVPILFDVDEKEIYGYGVHESELVRK